MNVSVTDKGNTAFKLTVTSSNEVRIKVQQGVDENQTKLYVKRLEHVAQDIIQIGWNKTTLRGKCRAGDNTIYMQTKYEKVPGHRFQFVGPRQANK